jgi:cardiolipin synthase (CMP-forming)
LGQDISTRRSSAGGQRLLTVPNVLTSLRILLIPLFVVLLLDPDTRLPGYALLAVVVSTDWIDGYIARRSGQVTELGKLLDPLADRLALAAAIVTFVAVEAFPLWAALLVLVRDALVLIVAGLLGARGIRIDVRPIGKYATATVWLSVAFIAWSNFGFAFDDVAWVMGWVWFFVGVAEYYAATVAYALDVRRALSGRPA